MQKRIQKILSEHGVASRRAAEALITAGRVRVDGKPAELGQSADDEKAKITVDGKPLRKRPPMVYLMFNKPRGVVTSLSDEQGRRDLHGFFEGVKQRVVPVGRLDRNSEGLLLLTNDGELVQRLTHPSHAIDKRYRVTVRGDLEAGLPKMRESILIDGKPTLPAQVSIATHAGTAGRDDPGAPQPPAHAVLNVILREGRKRQIRLLCEHAGLTIGRLSRRAVGELTLGGLEPGKHRFLTEKEIQYLKTL
jgi:23S rRNA pseudouridine2605 synthase